MATRIQVRRDTLANWTLFNPVLANGEITYVTDTAFIKVGDGTTAWNSLPYATQVGNVAVGANGAVTGGSATFVANITGGNIIANTATYSAQYNYANGVSILASFNSFASYANANLGTATTNISALQANVGAYEIYANANLGTATTNITTLFSNAASQQTTLNLLDANLGTATTNITTLFSNAAAQATTLNIHDANLGTATTNIQTLSANIGAYELYANTSLSTLTANAGTQQASIDSLRTNANANTAAYLAAGVATVKVTNSTEATGAATGAFQVTGGASIGANLYIGGNLIVSGNTYELQTEIISQSVVVASNVTAGAYFYANGTPLNYGNVQAAAYLASNTDPTISNLNGNAAAQAVSINAINANLGTVVATTIPAINANIGTIVATTIPTIQANLGAYEFWANTNFAYANTTFATGASTSAIQANLGAYQIYANANLGTATTNITTLFSNAASQQTSIDSLRTGANANTTAFLTTLAFTAPTANVSLYDSVTPTTTNAIFYPQLVDKTSGNVAGYTAGLSYNPSTGYLYANYGTFNSVYASAFGNLNSTFTGASISTTNGYIGTINASTINAATIGNTGATLTGTLSTATQNSVTTMTGLTLIGTAGQTTTVAGNLTIGGNLSVTGQSVSIGSSTLSVADPIINLHTASDLTPLLSNDGADIGLKFHYYDTADSAAFVGRANDTGFLEWYSRGSDTGNVFTGTAYGTIKTGALWLANTTASTGTTSATAGALYVAGGAGIAGTLNVGGTVTAAGVNLVATINSQDANIGTIVATTIPAINANLGAYQTFANANAASQQTQINNIVTTANANVAASLQNFTTNIVSTANVTANNIVGNNATINGANNTAMTIADGGTGIANWTLKRYTQGNPLFSTVEGNGTGLFFKPDGTVMYFSGQTGDRISEYALSTPWDITTATNVATSGTSILSQDTSNRAIFFKPDGTKMYMQGSGTQRVYEYTLSTAWWSNTASNVGAFVGNAWYGTTPNGLQFNSTGSRMYVANSAGNIQVFSLSTPWSVNSASYNSNFYANNSVESSYQGFSFNSSGNSLVLAGTTVSKGFVQYNLATPYDLTTAVYAGRQYYRDPVGGDNGASGVYGIYYADSVNSVFALDQTSDVVSQWNTNTSGVKVTSTGTTLFDGNIVNLANVVVVQPGISAGQPGYVNIFGNIIVSGVTQNHYIGGTINFSAISGTTVTTSGNATINSTTSTSQTNLVTGAVASGSIKLVSLATGGVAGSNSNVTIGPTLGVGNVFFQTATTVNIANATASTSTTSGAFVVAGGVGIGGDVFSGGNYNIGSYNRAVPTIYYSNSATGQYSAHLVQRANVELWLAGANPSENYVIRNNATTDWLTVANVTGNVVLSSTTTSTNTTTGALVVAGGVGITGSLYASSLGSFAGGVITNQLSSSSASARLYTDVQSNVTIGGTTSNVTILGNLIVSGNIYELQTEIINQSVVVASNVSATLFTYANGTDITTQISTLRRGAGLSNVNIATGNDVITFGVYNPSTGTAANSFTVCSNIVHVNTNLRVFNNSQLDGTLGVAGNVIVSNIAGSNFTWSNGVSILQGVGGTYTNSNVAAYLPTYTGNITGANFIGNIRSPGLTNIVYITGNLIPSQSNVYSLGSATNWFTGLYISGNTINLGGQTIKSTPTGFSFQTAGGGRFDYDDTYGGFTNFYSAGGQQPDPAQMYNLKLTGGYATQNATTGALVVNGGIGLNGNLYSSQNIFGADFILTGTGQSISTVYAGNTYVQSLVTTANTGVVNYVNTKVNAVQDGLNFANASLTAANSAIIVANTSMRGYVDTANTSMKAYVDGQITAQSTATVSYVAGVNNAITTAINSNITTVNSAITTANAGVVSYVDAKFGSLSTGANANTAAYLSNYSGNVVAGNILATGFYFANGTPFISASGGSGTYSNANVTSYLPVYSGNISATNVNTTSLYATNIYSTYSNATLTQSYQPYITTVGNLANLTVAGNITATNIVVGTPLPYTQRDAALRIGANTNNRAQIAIQNTSNGYNATTNFVAYADNGDDGNAYVQTGIVSSGYVVGGNELLYPADAYVTARGPLIRPGNLITRGGNLLISTATARDIIFSTNGAGVANQVGRFVNTQGLVIYPTTQSANVYTGALVVQGGAAIQKDVYVGGNLFVAGNTTTINTYVQTEYVTGNEVVAGNLIANSGISSTSTTSGAVQVLGGLGVTGNVYAGTVRTGSVYATGLYWAGNGNVISTGGTSGNITLRGSLTDVVIQNPEANDILTWNGAYWVNNAPGAASVASTIFIPQATSDLGLVTDLGVSHAEDNGVVTEIAAFAYDMGVLRLDGVVSLNNLDQSVKSDYLGYSIIFGF
jgi:hypothetical protein